MTMAKVAVNFIQVLREVPHEDRQAKCNLVTNSLSRGLKKKFKGRGYNTAYGKMEQLHDRDCFKAIDIKDDFANREKESDGVV